MSDSRIQHFDWQARIVELERERDEALLRQSELGRNYVVLEQKYFKQRQAIEAALEKINSAVPATMSPSLRRRLGWGLREALK